MAVTINGTTGLATDSTSAVVEAVSLNHPSSSTAAITMDASNNVTVNGAFTSQGIDDNATSTAVTLDSSGNVGIGTSSPNNKLHVAGNMTVGDTASTYGEIVFNNSTITGTTRIRQLNNDGLLFFQNNDEKMRLDSSGNLLVGTTTRDIGEPRLVVQASSGGTSRHAMLLKSETTGYSCGLIWNVGTSGTRQLFQFATSATYTAVGSITSNGSSTSYNTTSDYRLKENVVDLTGASDRVNQIPVHRFNFISNPDTTVDGFLAHEVQAVVPEAITGTHNEVDEDGNPVYQQIDQAKIVPLLTAALQEALAKIETLETEMTSVKARLEALETP